MNAPPAGAPPARARLIIGIVASALLVLSSAAHSIVGAMQMEAEFAKAGVPDDLALGLRAGWQFGGAAMLVFGLIGLDAFVGRLRGRAVPLRPVLLTAVMYLLFGAWALAMSGFDPFFSVFVVPGVLLLAAAWPRAGDDAPSAG